MYVSIPHYPQWRHSVSSLEGNKSRAERNARTRHVCSKRMTAVGEMTDTDTYTYTYIYRSDY